MKGRMDRKDFWVKKEMKEKKKASSLYLIAFPVNPDRPVILSCPKKIC
jgi:hypothetical protein